MAITVKQIISPMGRNTTLSSAQTITIPANANYVELQPTTNNVYITLDGTDPNNVEGEENGFLLLKNGIYGHELHPNNSIKVIEVTASAQLNYQFYKLNITP